MTSEIALLGVVVFIAYAVQTMSGFGAVVIAVTLGAQILPIPEVQAIVVPLSILQCGYIALRHKGGIQWRPLLREILPIMGIGMAIGFALIDYFQGNTLRVAFAIFVLIVSLKELWTILQSMRQPTLKTNPSTTPGETPAPASDSANLMGFPAYLSWLGVSGIIHGIYATGGPSLVYALNRRGLSKYNFRSTLTVVWLLLNSVLSIKMLVSGQISIQEATSILWLLPTLVAGIFVGEKLHHKLPERTFKLAVFSILCIAAIVLIFR